MAKQLHNIETIQGVNSDLITVVLPLPHPCLSPNARAHWGAKGHAVSKYRYLAKMAATAAYMPGAKPEYSRAILRVTFYHKVRRRRDRDNHLAMLKSAFDGMVDAGLVLNDSEISFEAIEFEVSVDPRVEVQVRKG